MFRNKNVSEFVGKHFWFLGSKFCFCNNVSRGGQTGKHYRKHNVTAKAKIIRQEFSNSVILLGRESPLETISRDIYSVHNIIYFLLGFEPISLLVSFLVLSRQDMKIV